MSDVNWTTLEDYTPENVVKNVRNKAGLYWLSRRVKEEERIVFYIGQSEDLQNRLMGHLQPSEENSCIKENLKYSPQYSVYYISSEEIRQNEERKLIEQHKPLCNQV